MMMNKDEYLSMLRTELFAMPVEERENAVSFYEEMFDEAGEDKAAAVIADLGSPVDLARAILCDNSDYSRSIKNATASQRLFVENCRREKAEDEGYAGYNIGFASRNYKDPEPAPNINIETADKSADHGFVDLSKENKQSEPDGTPFSYGDMRNATNADSSRVNYTYNQPRQNNDREQNGQNGQSNSKGIYSLIGFILGLVFLLPFIAVGGVFAAILLVTVLLFFLGLGFGALGCIIAAAVLIIASIPNMISEGLASGLMTFGGGLLCGGVGILLCMIVRVIIKKGIPSIGGWIGRTYNKIRNFFERKDRFQ